MIRKSAGLRVMDLKGDKEKFFISDQEAGLQNNGSLTAAAGFHARAQVLGEISDVNSGTVSLTGNKNKKEPFHGKNTR